MASKKKQPTQDASAASQCVHQPAPDAAPFVLATIGPFVRTLCDHYGVSHSAPGIKEVLDIVSGPIEYSHREIAIPIRVEPISGERACKQCGNRFKPTRAWQEFCTRACRGKYNAQRKAAEKSK